MFDRPLKDLWIITYPFGKWYKWGKHKGVDLRSKTTKNPDGIGMKVYCPRDGQYEKVGKDAKGGNYVKIKHDNGFVSLYFHLDSYTYQNGWKDVKKGDIIGYTGNSGKQTTAAHLHWEIRKDGVPVDPIPLLNENNSIIKDMINQLDDIKSKIDTIIFNLKKNI